MTEGEDKETMQEPVCSGHFYYFKLAKFPQHVSCTLFSEHRLTSASVGIFNISTLETSWLLVGRLILLWLPADFPPVTPVWDLRQSLPFPTCLTSPLCHKHCLLNSRGEGSWEIGFGCCGLFYLGIINVQRKRKLSRVPLKDRLAVRAVSQGTQFISLRQGDPAGTWTSGSRESRLNNGDVEATQPLPPAKKD